MFSHGPHGPYSYLWSPRVDPNTPSQQDIREEFALFSTSWRTLLSAARREKWNTYAANVLVSRRLGRPRRLTGFNHHVRTESFRGYVGLYPSDGPPELFTLGRLGAPTYNTFFYNINATFDLADPWRADWLGGFALFASRPQPITVNHFTGPFRHIGTQPGFPPDPPTQRWFSLPPGFWPSPSSPVIFARARVAEGDGRLSPDNVQRLVFSY